MRKLTYFIACSIDGFIGDSSGDASAMMAFVSEEFLGFLKSEYPETISVEGRSMLGFHDAENQHFDTVVQGRRSYQLALDADITSPYGHLREVVASRTLTESPHPNVELIGEDPVARIRSSRPRTASWTSGSAADPSWRGSCSTRSTSS